jgi:hypothetical protein
MSSFARSRKGDKLRGNIRGADRRENLWWEVGGRNARALLVRALCGREVHERRCTPWGQSWRIFAPRVEMQALANIGGSTQTRQQRLGSNSPNQDSTFSPIASAGLPPANSPQTFLAGSASPPSEATLHPACHRIGNFMESIRSSELSFFHPHASGLAMVQA